jgi:hypothetical protein
METRIDVTPARQPATGHRQPATGPRQLILAFTAAILVSVFGFFFFRDNFSTHYPIKALSALSFRAGEIPYWNFSDGGGQPLAGNPNTLTFYPDNVLYVLLPADVAFNLHFLLHLGLAWLAMRALVRDVVRRRLEAAPANVERRWPVPDSSSFAAWVYVLSGLAVTATAFYNLVTAVALIPIALLAAERRSPLLLGTAFGLLALGTEPVTLLGTAIAVAVIAFGRMRVPEVAGAAVIATVISLPQLIAYGEIAREVERAHGFSARVVLSASLSPVRVLELLIGPFFARSEPRLFLSLFIGLIAIPAVLQRSRYVAIVGTMLFLALGRFNPVAAAILPQMRVARYPEKFVMPMIVALVVLAGLFFERTPWKRTWTWITFVPLVAWAAVTLPIDWFAPYRLTPQPSRRLFVVAAPGGQTPDRRDYRERAARLEPLFGAIGGVQYVLNRSGDDMHSLLSRIVVERVATTGGAAYLRIAAGPRAFIVPRAIGVPSVNEAVARIERGERGIAPSRYAGFTSPSDARVVRYAERVQSIEVTVTTSAPAILFINQSYFSAWVARSGEHELTTMPLDLDRLGVIVPPGTHEITLRFGRHRTLVAAAWVPSWLVLIAALFMTSAYPWFGSFRR